MKTIKEAPIQQAEATFLDYSAAHKLKTLAAHPFDLTKEGNLTPERLNEFVAEGCGYRLLYGTDMGMEKHMYQVTFRVLETLDEHFYESELFGYHWAMSGFGLNDTILEKIYMDNAKKIQQYENEH